MGLTGVTKTERRYRALVARAKAHPGTPEAELCEQLAAKMLETHGQDLAEATDLPVEEHKFAWRDWNERELIVWACLFFDLVPMSRTGSRAKKILVECDESTAALLTHAIEVLQPRLTKILLATAAGFLGGAFPRPPSPAQEDPDEDETPPDFDEIQAAAAARSAGRRHTPRKALTE